MLKTLLVNFVEPSTYFLCVKQQVSQSSQLFSAWYSGAVSYTIILVNVIFNIWRQQVIIIFTLSRPAPQPKPVSTAQTANSSTTTSSCSRGKVIMLAPKPTTLFPRVTSSLPYVTSSLPHETSSLPYMTSSLPYVTSSLTYVTSSLPNVTSLLPPSAGHTVMASAAANASPFVPLPIAEAEITKVGSSLEMRIVMTISTLVILSQYFCSHNFNIIRTKLPFY